MESKEFLLTLISIVYFGCYVEFNVHVRPRLSKSHQINSKITDKQAIIFFNFCIIYYSYRITPKRLKSKFYFQLIKIRLGLRESLLLLFYVIKVLKKSKALLSIFFMKTGFHRVCSLLKPIRKKYQYKI